MNIKLCKIELYDWVSSDEISLSSLFDDRSRPKDAWHKTFLCPKDNQHKIGVSVKYHVASNDTCYAMFYHQFSFLHEYFPPDLEEPFYIDGDLDFAKNYVDNFLIRMNNLVPFL